ncbi:MAG: hypothetical protein HQL36_03160 [Alphaproteobacteria bacterium]|nr:hypothetical protein [Alphaproteobacteria bacterium]MBF0249578.1 hypothetical protein [Alphaproteobacteria bacterium]
MSSAALHLNTLLVKAPVVKAFATSSIGATGAVAALVGGTSVLTLGALGAAAGAAVYGVLKARETDETIRSRKLFGVKNPAQTALDAFRRVFA